MATVTKGRTFTSGETVTPAKLNDVVDMATVTFSTASDTDDSTLEVSGNKFRVKDSGVTLAKLVTAVQQALLPVGAVQAFARSTAPAGWLSANGNTIGSASSGATNASADYSALFAVLWDNWSNTDLPILDSAGAASTRGASASADFSANKRLPLPDLRGIFVRGSGSQTISGVTYNKTFSAKEGDAFQNFTGTITTAIDLLGGTGAFAAGSAGSSLRPTGTATTRGVTFDPSTVARTSTETRPANIALLYCIKF